MTDLQNSIMQQFFEQTEPSIEQAFFQQSNNAGLVELKFPDNRMLPRANTAKIESPKLNNESPTLQFPKSQSTHRIQEVKFFTKSPKLNYTLDIKLREEIKTCSLQTLELPSLIRQPKHIVSGSGISTFKPRARQPRQPHVRVLKSSADKKYTQDLMSLFKEFHADK